MKDKQKIHFPQKKKRPSCRFWIFRLHDVLFCSGVASRRRHWPPTVRQHRGARLVEGGVREDSDPKPSPQMEWLGWGVYCREQEARVRRKKVEEGGGRGRREGAGACLTAPCCQVCLFVCPHTVEINLPSVELWTQRGEKVSKHNQDTCRQETVITPTADPSLPTTWCWRWGRGCAAGGANEGFGWVGE